MTRLEQRRQNELAEQHSKEEELRRLQTKQYDRISRLQEADDIARSEKLQEELVSMNYGDPDPPAHHTSGETRLERRRRLEARDAQALRGDVDSARMRLDTDDLVNRAMNGEEIGFTDIEGVEPLFPSMQQAEPQYFQQGPDKSWFENLTDTIPDWAKAPQYSEGNKAARALFDFDQNELAEEINAMPISEQEKQEIWEGKQVKGGGPAPDWMKSGFDNSVLGKAKHLLTGSKQFDLRFHEGDPERGIEGNSAMWERVAAGGMALMMDYPIFRGGTLFMKGAIGMAKGVQWAAKAALKGGQRVKEAIMGVGVSEAAATQIVSKAAPQLFEAMAVGSGQFAGWHATHEWFDQANEHGVFAVEYGEVLEEAGIGAVTGAVIPVAGLGARLIGGKMIGGYVGRATDKVFGTQAYGAGGKYAPRIEKAMGDIASTAAEIGTFANIGRIWGDPPPTAESYIETAMLIGMMKLSHGKPPAGFNQGPHSPKITLSSTEWSDIRKVGTKQGKKPPKMPVTKGEETAADYFRNNPDVVAEILKDPNMPINIKDKILSVFGIRPNNLMGIDNAEIVKTKDGKFKVRLLGPEGEYISSYETRSEAEALSLRNAIEAQKMDTKPITYEKDPGFVYPEDIFTEAPKGIAGSGEKGKPLTPQAGVKSEPDLIMAELGTLKDAHTETDKKALQSRIDKEREGLESGFSYDASTDKLTKVSPDQAKLELDKLNQAQKTLESLVTPEAPESDLAPHKRKVVKKKAKPAGNVKTMKFIKANKLEDNIAPEELKAKRKELFGSEEIDLKTADNEAMQKYNEWVKEKAGHKDYDMTVTDLKKELKSRKEKHPDDDLTLSGTREELQRKLREHDKKLSTRSRNAALIPKTPVPEKPKVINVKPQPGTKPNPDIGATSQVIGGVQYKFKKGYGFQESQLPKEGKEALAKERAQRDKQDTEKSEAGQADVVSVEAEKKIPEQIKAIAESKGLDIEGDEIRQILDQQAGIPSRRVVGGPQVKVMKRLNELEAKDANRVLKAVSRYEPVVEEITPTISEKPEIVESKGVEPAYTEGMDLKSSTAEYADPDNVYFKHKKSGKPIVKFSKDFDPAQAAELEAKLRGIVASKDQKLWSPMMGVRQGTETSPHEVIKAVYMNVMDKSPGNKGKTDLLDGIKKELTNQNRAGEAVDRLRNAGSFGNKNFFGQGDLNYTRRQKFEDAAWVGAEVIRRGAKNFQQFSKTMMGKVGKSIKAQLSKLYQTAKKYIKDYWENPKIGASIEDVSRKPVIESKHLDNKIVKKAYESLPEPKDVEGRIRKKLGREDKIGKPVNKRQVLQNDKFRITVGDRTHKDWVDDITRNMSTKEITEARGWYGKVRDLFVRTFGEAEADKRMIGWLVAQKNASPLAGMDYMLRVAEQLAGGRAGKKGGLADRELRELLSGERITQGLGQKLFDFVDSALGSVTRRFMGNQPIGGAPVVVDIWTSRDRGFITPAYRNILESVFGKDKLKKLKLDRNGEQPGEPQYEKTAEWFNALSKYLNDNNIDGGKWTPEQVQAVGWMSMIKMSGRAGETPEMAIAERTTDIAVELDFGVGAPYIKEFPGLAKLSPAKKAAVTYAMVDHVLKDIEPLYGVKVLSREHGTGYWLDYGGNPNTIIKFIGSKTGVEEAMAHLGYTMQQTEAYASKPSIRGRGVAIDIYIPTDAASGGMLKHGDAIYEALRKAHGVVERSDGSYKVTATEFIAGASPIEVTTKDGKKYSGLRFGIEVNSPSELKVAERIKFLENHAQEIVNLMSPTLDKLGVGARQRALPIDEIKLKNDWRKNPNGEDYLRRFRERPERPSIQGRLEREIVPRFKEELKRQISTAEGRSGPERVTFKSKEAMDEYIRTYKGDKVITPHPDKLFVNLKPKQNRKLASEEIDAKERELGAGSDALSQMRKRETQLFGQADAAFRRLEDSGSFGTKNFFGTKDPNYTARQKFTDALHVSAAILSKGVKSFQQYSKEMIKKVGKSVKPLLSRLYKSAKAYVKDYWENPRIGASIQIVDANGKPLKGIPKTEREVRVRHVAARLRNVESFVTGEGEYAKEWTKGIFGGGAPTTRRALMKQRAILFGAVAKNQFRNIQDAVDASLGQGQYAGREPSEVAMTTLQSYATFLTRYQNRAQAVSALKLIETEAPQPALLTQQTLKESVIRDKYKLPGRVVKDIKKNEVADPELRKALDMAARQRFGVMAPNVGALSARNAARSITQTDQYMETIQRLTGLPTYELWVKMEEGLGTADRALADVQSPFFKVLKTKKIKKLGVTLDAGGRNIDIDNKYVNIVSGRKRGIPNPNYLDVEARWQMHRYINGDIDANALKNTSGELALNLADAIKKVYTSPEYRQTVRIVRWERAVKINAEKEAMGEPIEFAGLEPEVYEKLKALYDKRGKRGGTEKFLAELEQAEGFLIEENYAPLRETIVEQDILANRGGMGFGHTFSRLAEQYGEAAVAQDAIDNFLRHTRAFTKSMHMEEPMLAMLELANTKGLDSRIATDIRENIKAINEPFVSDMYSDFISKFIGNTMRTALTKPNKWARNWWQRLTLIPLADMRDMGKFTRKIANSSFRRGGIDVRASKEFKDMPDSVQNDFMMMVAQEASLETDFLKSASMPILDKIPIIGQKARSIIDVYKQVDTSSRWVIYKSVYDHVLEQLNSGKGYGKIKGRIFMDQVPISMKEILLHEISAGNTEYVARQIARQMANRTQFKYGRHARSRVEKGPIGRVAFAATVYPRTLMSNLIDNTRKFGYGIEAIGRGHSDGWGQLGQGLKGLLGQAAVMALFEKGMDELFGYKSVFSHGWSLVDAISFEPGSLGSLGPEAIEQTISPVKEFLGVSYDAIKGDASSYEFEQASLKLAGQIARLTDSISIHQLVFYQWSLEIVEALHGKKHHSIKPLQDALAKFEGKFHPKEVKYTKGQMLQKMLGGNAKKYRDYMVENSIGTPDLFNTKSWNVGLGYNPDAKINVGIGWTGEELGPKEGWIRDSGVEDTPPTSRYVE